MRVRPGAGRSAILGRREDGCLEVALRAAPEGGKANAELIRILARELKVPGGHVAIVRGATARTKIVRVIGADPGSAAALGTESGTSPAPGKQKTERIPERRS